MMNVTGGCKFTSSIPCQKKLKRFPYQTCLEVVDQQQVYLAISEAAFSQFFSSVFVNKRTKSILKKYINIRRQINKQKTIFSKGDSNQPRSTNPLRPPTPTEGDLMFPQGDQMLPQGVGRSTDPRPPAVMSIARDQNRKRQTSRHGPRRRSM